jgi:hypothetical protein
MADTLGTAVRGHGERVRGVSPPRYAVTCNEERSKHLQVVCDGQG